jgi:hypothetical protein
MKSQKNILSKYLNSIEEAPAQRTKEWYEIRKNTLGGSEISTVISKNPYNTVQSMIGQKIGISKFNGNTACRWGTMFEHITEKYTEIVLRMKDKIQEAGSVPGVVPRQRYSPDGLGIVQLIDNKNKPDWYIILFEFKAPLGTLPNNKIPQHYTPQIQTGMLSIPIVDYSIFVNNCYRKCSLDDLNFNGVYDKEFHYGDYKKRKYGLEREIPYACGLICVYQTNEEYEAAYDHYDYGSNNDYDFGAAFADNEPDDSSGTDPNYYDDCDMDLIIASKNKLIDFGSADRNIVERMFDLYDQKRIKVMYYPVIANKDRINELEFITTHNLERTEENEKNPKSYAERCIKSFQKNCKSKGLCSIGYIPWKLMRSDVILEERDPNWMDTILDPINDTLERMQKINDAVDPISAYYDMYPPIDADEEYFEEIAGMSDFTLGIPVEEIIDGSNNTDY